MAKECPLYKTAHRDRYGLLKDYAKFNRHNMTKAEEILWRELRRGKQGTKNGLQVYKTISNHIFPDLPFAEVMAME